MAKAKLDKAPVSERALLQRINRRLAADNEVVKKSRPVYDQGRPVYSSDLGEFFRINLLRNFLVEGNVDLEALGRELGVLREWESLAGS